MADLFGSILGAGMNPQLDDLHKRAKKRLDQAMVPAIQKKNGSVGPGQQNAPKPVQGPTIWERISRGV